MTESATFLCLLPLTGAGLHRPWRLLRPLITNHVLQCLSKWRATHYVPPHLDAWHRLQQVLQPRALISSYHKQSQFEALLLELHVARLRNWMPLPHPHTRPRVGFPASPLCRRQLFPSSGAQPASASKPRPPTQDTCFLGVVEHTRKSLGALCVPQALRLPRSNQPSPPSPPVHLVLVAWTEPLSHDGHSHGQEVMEMIQHLRLTASAPSSPHPPPDHVPAAQRATKLLVVPVKVAYANGRLAVDAKKLQSSTLSPTLLLVASTK